MRQYRGMTKDGKWMFGWYLKDGKNHYIFPDKRKHSFIGNFIKVLPETVGQTTGLKDENGKDLNWWEGDIIEFSYQHGFIGALQTEIIVGAITFEQGQYWVGEYPIQRAIDEYGNKISNIHENPELLKD